MKRGFQLSLRTIPPGKSGVYQPRPAAQGQPGSLMPGEV